MTTELFERLVLALESQVAQGKQAARDFKEREDRARRDWRKAQEHAQSEAVATRTLMVEQAERNERSLAMQETELARLRARDEEYVKFLAEQAARSIEQTETLKVATGLAAPDFVPENLVSVPDDSEDEHDAES